MIDCMGIGDDPTIGCLPEYRFQNCRWHLLATDHLPQHIAGTDRWKLVSITYDDQLGSWLDSLQQHIRKAHIHHRELIHHDEICREHFRIVEWTVLFGDQTKS